jgi:hypothetical protein
VVLLLPFPPLLCCLLPTLVRVHPSHPPAGVCHSSVSLPPFVPVPPLIVRACLRPLGCTHLFGLPSLLVRTRSCWPIPAPALLPFTHPRSCSPLPSACWCLSFIRVPAPVCTRPLARRLCLFTPTRLCAFGWPSFAFVWPTQLTCSHSLTLAPLVCAHQLSLAPALAHTGPMARTGPCLFSVSHLPQPLLLLLLPLGHHMVSISNT